jgi:hypothetical protein
MSHKHESLTEIQKYELCRYARDNNKKTRSDYVQWVEQKWGIKVSVSTITRVLQTKDERLTTEIKNPNAKRHKPVTFPELELALKEFILVYQNKTILSEALIVEKAKLLAKGFNISENELKFSNGWLQKFKDRNGIHQVLLYGESASADDNAIAVSLPILQDKCNQYPLERIYNMDETGLFYRFILFFLFYFILFF